MENYREYQGRNVRKPAPKKPIGSCLKKLIRQTLISLLIVGIVFSPLSEKSNGASKLKEWVKDAINFEINTEKLSDVLKNILKKSIPTNIQGDLDNEEKTVSEKTF